MLYYLLIGLILAVVYQLTPLARKRPYNFLKGIPTIWFVLFSISRGPVIAFTYPLLILLFSAAYIYKWIEEGFPWQTRYIPGKYYDLIEGYLSIDSIMVDGSDKFYFRPDYPPTISSDDGLLKYTLHYY